MQVPFNDLKWQYNALRNEIHEKLEEVCKDTAFILSHHVDAFEQNFADFCQVRHCAGVNSGTDAILLALKAMGIGQGDEVILPANTFFATVEPVCHAGATPVLVDVDDQTKNIDPSRIAERITSRTKAIMPVHLFGNPAPMDEISAIAQQHGLDVIEDAAQAHGATYKGRTIGSMGRVAAFSFYPGKNLGAFGDGGALVSDDEKIIDQAKLLRNHGSPTKYDHDIVGYNSRLDSMQAVVLDCKLPHLAGWNARRRVHAAAYDEWLAEVPWLQVPETTPGSESVYHLYTVEIIDPAFDRDDLLDFLRQHGVGVGIHYPVPLHLTKALAFLGHGKGDFPIAEKTMANHLSLPMFAELTEQQIEHVVSTLRRYTPSLAKAQ